MAHRGPDASGHWADDLVTLGHRRLSIIDLSRAADQPFRSPDGRYVLVFNGEIYNFRELRSQLGDQVFVTDSDTEVLLAAYRTWGAEVLQRLHGMFAFAVYDARQRELFLARDRMGIKPLYFHRGDRHFVFASELRALLASELVPRRLDRVALVDHLRYQTVHAPRTLVEDVRMLMPGQWMRLSDEELTVKDWWTTEVAVDPEAATHEEARVHREVRERLTRA
ncbi:MAG: asparagine synthetase B, partial [Flavobacteriales bacterium]|nr:asparagine synthetase B [Flavobacteriales bacterium]